MKKIFTLLTVLFLFASSTCVVGCDDSDKKVTTSDGRLVSDVVIATSMPVFKGMEITIGGRGFLEGDKLSLRSAGDLPAVTTVASSSALTFVVPDEITDQGVYKFVLARGDDYQVLGASKLSVSLAVRVELDATIAASWDGPAVIRGEGFRTTDKLIMRYGGGSSEARISATDSRSLTFVVPVGTPEGDCEFILQRDEEQQSLGSAKLSLTAAAPVPDKPNATIKGMVHTNGRGIAGVLVSDGDLITETDANGHYWLQSEKRNTLAFVILPSGYDVPTQKAMPQFWKPCTLDVSTCERLDFTLAPVDNDAHTLLVATDMHLANRNTPLDYTQFADGFIKELSTAYNKSTKKVYCLNLGDFTWDAYWYDNKWQLPQSIGAVGGLNFQMWSAMGNHDNDPYVANDFGAEVPYRRYMGPVYYSMNIGKVHYIMLDNSVYTNAGGSQGTPGDREYYRRFDARQLVWLREDLSHVDKSTPVIVGYHCPVYSYSNVGQVSIALQRQADVNNFLGCFDGFQNVTLLSGHTHVNRNIQSPTYTNVYEQNIAAVCGTWWWTQQYAKNNVCTDGTPAGYKVFDINGTSVKWQYKSVGLPVQKQFMTYDMNSVKQYWATDETALKAFASGNLPGRANDYNTAAADEVYINIWAYEPGWTISVTENGTKLDVSQVWKRDPLHSISYDIPRGATTSLTFPTTWCMHMFSVKTSSPSTTLEIAVTDRFGNVYTESMKRPKALTADPSK